MLGSLEVMQEIYVTYVSSLSEGGNFRVNLAIEQYPFSTKPKLDMHYELIIFHV
jgi:hypothetical protein